MNPFLQALLLGSDNPPKVCSISNRMFALRFAPKGNFWSKNSFRGPVPSSVPHRSALAPSWVADSQGKPRQELAMPQELALLSLSNDSILWRARAWIQQERTALVSVQGKERPFVTSLPWSVTATATASSRSGRGFVSTHIPSGHFYHLQHLLSTPGPLLKIPVHYFWHCFNSAVDQDIFSYKVLWSENNIFQVRCKHCKRRTGAVEDPGHLMEVFFALVLQEFFCFGFNFISQWLL